MIPEQTLYAEDVRGMMLDVMEKHLSLKTDGYRITTQETFNLLLKASAEGSIWRRFARTAAEWWTTTRYANN